MNLRQMRALAVRFSVPVTACVAGASVVVAVAQSHDAQARSVDQLLAVITTAQGLVADFGDSRE